MGRAPSEVWAMSLWEFHAAWSGWVRANTAGDDKPSAPSLAEHRALVERAMRHG